MYKILFILVSLLAVGCIDGQYDITKVSTDHVAFGDQASEFKAPLATILVTMDEIANDEMNVEEMFDEANTWLPSAVEVVDLELIHSSQSYRSGLIKQTTDEMKQSDAKRNALIALTAEKYYSTFAPAIGATSQSDYTAAFNRTLTTSPEAIERLIEQIANEYLSDLIIKPLVYEMGALNVSKEVADMLTEGIDSESSLSIYGTISSGLPLDINLSATFERTDLTLNSQVRSDNESSDIDQTAVTESDLRTVIDGSTVHLNVVLRNYYPQRGFSEELLHQITINLKLIKRGGMKINL